MAVILTTPHFDRQLEGLDESVRVLLKSCLERFQPNKNDPRLRIKKLSGRFKDYRSFRVGRNFRVLFRPLGNERYLFLDIDDRKDIYR